MTGRLQNAEDKEFRVSKKRVLAELEACIDRSKKGAVDEQVGDVIGLLNDHPGFVTTSSCSGRCAIFLEGSEKKKQSGKWLLASHDLVESEDVWNALQTPELQQSHGSVMFKFEPVVLHVQCRTLFLARDLLKTVLDAGMRNSGMVLGKKFMVAVRTTLRLEVPVAHAGSLLVDRAYVQHLVAMTNDMFAANFERIARVTEAIRGLFQQLHQNQVKAEEKERARALKKQRGLERAAFTTKQTAEATTSTSSTSNCSAAEKGSGNTKGLSAHAGNDDDDDADEGGVGAFVLFS